MKTLLFITLLTLCVSSYAYTDIIITNNGTFKSTTNKILGRIQNERIQSSNGITLGWVNEDTIRDKSGNKIGLIQNNKVRSSSGKLLGFISDNGIARDSHGRQLGIMKNVRREWIAVYYFFDLFN